jgi:ATP synthase protein I
MKAKHPGCHSESGMSDSAPDPEGLRTLGERLDEVRRRGMSTHRRGEAPASMGIAFRFTAELVSALVVGGAVGWGLDWLFGYFGVHTRPVFLLVMFILGAAAGIRNVMRAAKEINADIAAESDKGK